MTKFIFSLINFQQPITAQNLYNDAVAMWEFGANSSTIGNDYKGNHNASAQNLLTKTTSNLSGIDSQNLIYTGTNSAYIQIPYNVNLRLDNQSWTIASLFRFGAISVTSGYQFAPIFCKDMYLSGLRSGVLALEKDNSANPSVFIQIFNNNSANTFIQKYFTDSNWHLAIAEYKYDSTVSNTKLKLYFDNILHQEITPTFAISDSANDYCLMSRFDSTSIPSSANAPYPAAYNYQNQYIYRWNRELTQDERDYLWNNGNFKYLRP